MLAEATGVTKIVIACGRTDIRKCIDGLAQFVGTKYNMNPFEENVNDEKCIDTIRIMSGNKNLDEMPHYDTLNYYLEKLSPECLAEVRRKMVTSLIRGKHFNRGRLLGKYWRIILDGTGFFCFHEKHYDNCPKIQEN